MGRSRESGTAPRNSRSPSSPSSARAQQNTTPPTPAPTDVEQARGRPSLRSWPSDESATQQAFEAHAAARQAPEDLHPLTKLEYGQRAWKLVSSCFDMIKSAESDPRYADSTLLRRLAKTSVPGTARNSPALRDIWRNLPDPDQEDAAAIRDTFLGIIGELKKRVAVMDIRRAGDDGVDQKKTQQFRKAALGYLDKELRALAGIEVPTGSSGRWARFFGCCVASTLFSFGLAYANPSPQYQTGMAQLFSQIVNWMKGPSHLLEPTANSDLAKYYFWDRASIWAMPALGWLPVTNPAAIALLLKQHLPEKLAQGAEDYIQFAIKAQTPGHPEFVGYVTFMSIFQTYSYLKAYNIFADAGKLLGSARGHLFQKANASNQGREVANYGADGDTPYREEEFVGLLQRLMLIKDAAMHTMTENGGKLLGDAFSVKVELASTPVDDLYALSSQVIPTLRKAPDLSVLLEAARNLSEGRQAISAKSDKDFNKTVLYATLGIMASATAAIQTASASKGNTALVVDLATFYMALLARFGLDLAQFGRFPTEILRKFVDRWASSLVSLPWNAADLAYLTVKGRGIWDLTRILPSNQTQSASNASTSLGTELERRGGVTHPSAELAQLAEHPEFLGLCEKLDFDPEHVLFCMHVQDQASADLKRLLEEAEQDRSTENNGPLQAESGPHPFLESILRTLVDAPEPGPTPAPPRSPPELGSKDADRPTAGGMGLARLPRSLAVAPTGNASLGPSSTPLAEGYPQAGTIPTAAIAATAGFVVYIALMTLIAHQIKPMTKFVAEKGFSGLTNVMNKVGGRTAQAAPERGTDSDDLSAEELRVILDRPQTAPPPEEEGIDQIPKEIAPIPALEEEMAASRAQLDALLTPSGEAGVLQPRAAFPDAGGLTAQDALDAMLASHATWPRKLDTDQQDHLASVLAGVQAGGIQPSAMRPLLEILFQHLQPADRADAVTDQELDGVAAMLAELEQRRITLSAYLAEGGRNDNDIEPYAPPPRHAAPETGQSPSAQMG